MRNPFRKGREPPVDAAAALEESQRSRRQSEADLAEQKRKLEASKTVMRTFDKIVAENNLADLIYQAFSDAYRRKGGPGERR